MRKDEAKSQANGRDQGKG